MHNQVLVIYPKDVDLDTVMYPYQELDMTQDEKMNDERARFFLTVREDEIPAILEKIKEHSENRKNEMLERIQYRSQHSLKETLEKYGKNTMSHAFTVYKSYCDDLAKYDEIKKLPFDDPRQIRFILDNRYLATDKWIDIYIKGQGYGTFHNPWELWDYWKIVDEFRFPRGTCFLVDEAGNKSNTVPLGKLAIDDTVENIRELTYVWEHIILHSKDSRMSQIFSTNKIHFDEDWNESCLVDDLTGVLSQIKDMYGDDDDYQVAALDFHW